jgi:hypothetical protein
MWVNVKGFSSGQPFETGNPRSSDESCRMPYLGLAVVCPALIPSSSHAHECLQASSKTSLWLARSIVRCTAGRIFSDSYGDSGCFVVVWVDSVIPRALMPSEVSSSSDKRFFSFRLSLLDSYLALFLFLSESADHWKKKEQKESLCQDRSCCLRLCAIFFN